MSSINIDDNDWFDDPDDFVEENSSAKSDRVVSQMETLDRKKINREGVGRSPQSRERPRGLVESMMKCVITDSTLEHVPKSYQVEMTPRTERRFQSPLLSGRRVLSQIPRVAVPSSPLHSPRRNRVGHDRVRVYASPGRYSRERQIILQSKLQQNKDVNMRKREKSHGEEERPLVTHFATPVPSKRLTPDFFSQACDKEVIVLKGLLWVQQDRLFSRWKERFVVLTSNYLQFFKKTSSRISEMGGFIMKVKLNDMSSVSLEDRRGYLTLVIYCNKEGRLVIRKTEGIRDWHDSLEMFIARCKLNSEDRRMESTEEFWDRSGKKTAGKQNNSGIAFDGGKQIGSPLLGKSHLTLCRNSNLLPASSLSGRSLDEDSGLESMKTSMSDSGSSSLHATPSTGLTDEEKQREENFSYLKIDKHENGEAIKRLEKHERGVSVAEYSKFRAKLPFITP